MISPVVLGEERGRGWGAGGRREDASTFSPSLRVLGALSPRVRRRRDKAALYFKAFAPSCAQSFTVYKHFSPLLSGLKRTL